MAEFIIAGILALLAMLLSGLNKAYLDISAKELARRSREGDEHAFVLHLVAKYGAEVSLVFWPIIIICSSVSLILFAKQANILGSVAICAVLLTVTFLYLPRARTNKVMAKLAEKLAPRLAKILAWLEPATRRLIGISKKHQKRETYIYNKEDLRELLINQKESQDNRIDPLIIDILTHVLRSTGRQIYSYMVPLESTKIVSIQESIGPILINELHQTKQTYFPVREAKKKNILGTFYIGDLLEQAEGGKIKDVMNKKLFFVNEKQSIETVVDAFVKTKSHLFMVINDHQKIMGVITVDEVLKQLLGHSFLTYFDSYESPESVAKTSSTDQEEV